MAPIYFANVKSVISADTLVLSSPKGSEERVLSLQYLQAPRLQSNDKYAFESRELLRTLLVGKKIKFWVNYKTNNGREFGDISTPLFPSLIEYVLEKGAAKLKDNAGSFDEEEDEELTKFKIAQEKAQNAQLGVWDPSAKSINLVSRPQSIDNTTPIESIIEKVISGDRLLARLIISKDTHCVIPVLIAGVRAPRSSSPDEAGEPYGDAAKNFVETKLLMRSVTINLLGESSTGVLVGKINHPAGNISGKILAEGLAEIVDWQSAIIGSAGMSALRKQEKLARDEGLNLWKSHVAKATKTSSGSSAITPGKTIHAVVSKVVSADTIVLRLANGSDATVQLASIRAPRINADNVQASYAPISKEYVRKKIIGKSVTAIIESIREGNEQFDERPMVTLKTASGVNIGKDLVTKGLCGVIRHRKGEDRPDYWDELIECEAQAIKARAGIHGSAVETGKIIDASENAARAKPYLFSFQNRSVIPAIVEHVSSGNRFKILLQKEGVKLTLVLGGLSNTSGHSELSEKATVLATDIFYQRDVDIQIYGVDRVGGFIGNIFAPGSKEPFQKTLLSQGLYESHERSLQDTKFASLLAEAENQAKENKVGLWENYDPAQDIQALNDSIENLKIEKEYLDAKVVEVLKDGTIAFQIIDESNNKLKSFMESFRSACSKFPVLTSFPKRGEVVAAKLSDNGKFYRAKVRSVNKIENAVEVQHVDYGTIEEVPLTDLKSITSSDFSLSSYKPQAHIAQLSLINMPPESQPDFFNEAIYALEELLDKNVVVCVNFKNPRADVEYDVVIYDPEVIASDPTMSVNKDMVQEGLVLVKKNNLNRYEQLLSEERQELLNLENSAKLSHVGCWQFGDIEGTEDF